ncbi:MAG TPA: PolC-type DNA polymerase III [Acholeplasmataceae bacterium]|nr:PolC-type DNA polymerase III [Acholeplasmataceae bacterium]
MSKSINKYELFLQQNAYTNKIIKSSKLKKVIVDPKLNTWDFHIEFNDYIDAGILFTFTKTIKEYFAIDSITNIDIVFIHKNKNDFSKYATDYFESTIHYLSEIKPSFSSLQNFEVEFNGEAYEIKVDEESVWVEEYFDEIYEAFKDLGINYKILVKVDENLKKISEKINDRIAVREQLIDEKSRNIVRTEEVKVRKVDFTKNYNGGTKVKISEIPIDTFGIDKYGNEHGNTRFIIEGEIVSVAIKQLTKTTLLEMTVADYDDAIVVKKFLNNKNDRSLAESLKVGMFVELSGEAKFDTYIREVTIMATRIGILENLKREVRKDKAKNKRVELHLHTKMSDMDGVTDVKDYIERAELWGHKAIAFTDHNGVSSYPDIAKAIKGKKIKPIFGVELDVVDPNEFVVISKHESNNNLLDETYVVFDLETTGLSQTHDFIIEIGAVKVRRGEVIDRFHSLVNPEREITSFIVDLTGINNEDLIRAPKINEVMPKFIDFIKDTILVAHNASFDMGFIKNKIIELGINYENYPYVDTLSLAKYFYHGEIKRFNLKSLSRFFKVELENHHRADEDAEATSKVWMKMIYDLIEKGIKTTNSLYEAIDPNESYKQMFPKHMTVLAKNQVGYKNIFEIVSKALTENFANGPKTLVSTLNHYRKDLLIGSACDLGDVFEKALNGTDEDLLKAIDFYDYIEVQPPTSYLHLAEKFNGDGKAIIEATITKIVKTAKKAGKLVVATGNVHYLDETDGIYRDIFIRTPVVGGGLHPLYGYENAPKQYFMTTTEMLNAFGFLDMELAEEIVITNTNIINNKIESVKPFPDELYSLPDDAFKDILGIESIAVETKRLVIENANKQYGDELHPLIKERIDKELESIIGNKFAPIYYISHLLVKKSLEDGYLVGSRGSVGSSFVATLMEITEVNPLKPHYYCKNGDFTVFHLTNEEIYTHGISENQKAFQPFFEGIKSGYDLPDQNCPICGNKLNKDGHDIPFETFLGLKGDKVPDIDLNFSGDYQAKAHEYVRDLLGEDYSFRAGTIQTVADKTAYGFVMGYLEDNNINARGAQVNRLAKKIVGVKRSTGQHPGGIVVVPKDKTIYDVTPIQYPANDTTSSWYTTHFDYHSFEDNLLKLDILGHDDPTVIKYLMDYVTKHPEEFPFDKAKDIPLADPNVLKLFSETKIIGVKEEDILSEVASFGIPEFGTSFTRDMLNQTKPDSFAGLVKISGLSHGTDVWLKNSKDLISGETEFGKISFDDIIGCRDDIMVQLVEYGIEPFKAFDIMEFVRKGRAKKDLETWSKHVDEMQRHDVPKWYIWSASQIQYMFPKAHATAYVIMALRIAWFKVYKPELFYSAFFSKRSTQFDYEAMVSGANAVRNKLNELEKIPMYQRKVKDNDLITTLGVAQEMLRRGLKFLPVSIHKSEATEFVIEKEGLRMPFVTVDGLGIGAALGIVEAREEKAFTSINDCLNRTKINKNVQGLLEDYGSFEDLNEVNNVIDVGLFADL